MTTISDIRSGLIDKILLTNYPLNNKMFIFVKLIKQEVVNKFYTKIVKTTTIVASLLAVTTTQAQNSLWAWGWNGSGQLGIGNTNNQYSSSPVQAGTDTDWSQISAGDVHSLAIKSNGTLWAWGWNGSSGRLGTGNTNIQYSSSPVQVGTATNWTKIYAGIGHSFAIKSDGTLWAWGQNIYGELGIGNTNIQYSSSPVQVGTATNWLQVSAGVGNTLALKSDGTLWAWGYGIYGKLGTGNVNNQHSPVQVGTATNWALISAGQYHSLAIKSDGTLWAWGENDKGQLGIGNTTNQNSPVQIGTATNWVQVDAGIGYSFALKSDGTLWAWGNGNLGQLGTGNTIDQNSPVQVGTDTNWTQINIGANYSLALKTNGTLWAWGDNTLGQLGIGNTTQQNNPVQIGTVTNGASISAGGGHILSFVNPTASIDKNEIKNFVVYPNPANSILNIDSNAQEGIKITIVDIAGKTLAEQTLKTGNNTINISSFANGVYFIKTEKGGVMKFVKN